MNSFRTILFFLCILNFTAVKAENYCLLVGQNNGGEGLERLNFAESDAKKFSEILANLSDFKVRNITVLLHPDSFELQHQLDRIKNVADKDKSGTGIFLFYYSGHADSRNFLLGNTRYSLIKIDEYIDEFPADVKIGIFDACQSGAVVTYKGGTTTEPFYLKNQQNVRGKVIIASSAANERAQESQTLKSSIFSFHWFNGLRGSADVSGDKKVTLNEAYQYAYRKTVETSALTNGEIQHPVYRFSIYGQGDIVLTDLNRGKSGIIVDASCSGKFLILSRNYLDVFADFYKEDQKLRFVNLSPGIYTVVNANGSDVGTCEVTVNQNSVSRLYKSMFQPNLLTESRIKGGVKLETLRSPDVSETAVKTSPLSKYSFGAGGGIVFPFMEWEQQIADLLLNLANIVYISDEWKLFFDGAWQIGSQKISGDVGVDYYWFNGSFGKLYSGAGTGLFYNGKEKSSVFAEKIGPLFTVHAGFTTNIGKQADLAVQIPYTACYRSGFSQSFGIELRFLFSGKYKDIKVLDYSN
jgi:hypothetical protein